MSTAVPQDITEAFFTPDDLLRLPDAVNYELVDGKLVERQMGMESSLVALQIGSLFNNFLRENPIGMAFGADASYQCFHDAPDKVRKPDVSFVRMERLPGGRAPHGHCRVAPDLAVEVVSPKDLAYELESKITDYLEAGVPVVWVVFPPTRRVTIRRPATSPLGTITDLREGETITGEDAMPGFAYSVGDFFHPTIGRSKAR
jgi:Uma2 family endonuclease